MKATLADENTELCPQRGIFPIIKVIMNHCIKCLKYKETLAIDEVLQSQHDKNSIVTDERRGESYKT